jgi:hypothetical protein
MLSDPYFKGCKRCHSNHQAESLSKIAIHPVESLDDPAKPMVWVFPKLSFCIDCGHAEIRFSESRGITFQTSFFHRFWVPQRGTKDCSEKRRDFC